MWSNLEVQSTETWVDISVLCTSDCRGAIFSTNIPVLCTSGVSYIVYATNIIGAPHLLSPHNVFSTSIMVHYTNGLKSFGWRERQRRVIFVEN